MKLECPNSLLIVNTSTPASNMPVAYEWRSVCGETPALLIPAIATASLQAFCTVAEERGTSGVFPGKR